MYVILMYSRLLILFYIKGLLIGLCIVLFCKIRGIEVLKKKNDSLFIIVYVFKILVWLYVFELLNIFKIL